MELEVVRAFSIFQSTSLLVKCAARGIENVATPNQPKSMSSLVQFKGQHDEEFEQTEESQLASV